MGAGAMHLIGYKAYRSGYFGCLADKDRYICFLYAKKRFREIVTYPKEDFESVHHFVAFLHKFVPLRFFLRRPLRMASLETSDLSAIGRRLERAMGADGVLSPGVAPCEPVSTRGPAG
jgi:hypothetical protein